MSILEFMIVAMIKSFRYLRCQELKEAGIWEEEDLHEENSLKLSLMVTAKLKNLMAMGTVFAPKLKGLAQL